MSVLKLKKNFASIDYREIVLHSQLGMIFSEEQALESCKKKNNNILIKPAQIILSDKNHHIKQLSVAQGLFANDDNKNNSATDITNKGVYLVSRGCVFEHLKSEFKPLTLDQQFSFRNKTIKRHLKKADLYKSISTFKTRMKKENFTRVMKFKKKFAAGKIIGLQNLIPGLAEKCEIVFFTENNMVAEIH